MTPTSALLAGSVLALIIPPVVFCLVGVAEGMSAVAVLEACVSQYSAPRQNLLLVALPGLVPMVLVGVAAWLLRRFGWRRAGDTAAVLAGLVPVLLVLVWVNLSFWPTFLPERRYAGFPHGLEFVIGPIFFAPAAALLGLVLWRVLGRGR